MTDKPDRAELEAARAFINAKADSIFRFTGMPDPALLLECRRCGSSDFYAGTCAVCHAGTPAQSSKGE